MTRVWMQWRLFLQHVLRYPLRNLECRWMGLGRHIVLVAGLRPPLPRCIIQGDGLPGLVKGGYGQHFIVDGSPGILVER